jgi:mRNA-degrading endonuclease toxin of MazEF toxin-antitoxin module
VGETQSGRGKKRPVVVVQGDVYNQRLRHAVVAQATTNLDEKGDPAYLLIEASSPGLPK